MALTSTNENINFVLMVSGGSDSTALLQMMCAYLSTRSFQEHALDAPLPRIVQLEFDSLIPQNASVHMQVVHINHLLRGSDAFADEAFVRTLCNSLNVDMYTERIDIAALTKEQGAKGGGVEAVARKERYRVAREQLDLLNAQHPCEKSYILTAHTLDDRIETFFMRVLVGTGPSGLASIPKSRAEIYRPLLGMERQELRDWLKEFSNNMPEHVLWREDKTNSDGSNFRSQVRLSLVQKAKELRENFPRNLANTLDLLSEEDAMLQASAQSFLYRNLSWEDNVVRISLDAVTEQQKPMQRRILREMFLAIKPNARLSSVHIERVISNFDNQNYITEIAGGIRVSIENGVINVQVNDGVNVKANDDVNA